MKLSLPYLLGAFLLNLALAIPGALSLVRDVLFTAALLVGPGLLLELPAPLPSWRSRVLSVLLGCAVGVGVRAIVQSIINY